MPRDPNPIGTFGKIHRIKRANGSWSARAYVRDADGQRRLVARTSTTGEAAERRLRQALAERTAGLGQPDDSPHGSTRSPSGGSPTCDELSRPATGRPTPHRSTGSTSIATS
jgi:hypothetical protein